MEERTRRLSTCWVPPVLLLLIGRLSSAESTAEFPVRLQDNGTVSISAVAPSKELKVNAGDATADTLTFLGDVHATGGVFVNGEPVATNKNSLLITDMPVCHEPGTDAMLGLPTGGFECDCLEGWSGPTCSEGGGGAATRLALGASFNCRVLSNNKAKCWGLNSAGQLGYGDTIQRGDLPNTMGDNLPYVDLGTGRTIKQISAGATHTCAILDNDKAKCWGYNNNGELGYGDMNDRGDGPNEMGDNLPYVDVGTGRTVKQISAGSSYTCAILDNDKLKCWGYSYYGQLGYGDTMQRGDGPNEMGDNLPYVDVGTGRTVKQISAGSSYTCAILDDDKVKCWGSNGGGQLGYGDTTTRGDGPNEMGDNLPYVDVGTGRTVKQISADAHTCAVLDNDKAKCWGSNGYGALGYGDTTTRGDEPNEMGDNLPYVDVGTGRTVKQISLDMHTCAILDNDKVKCWGRNWDGQLGYGDKNDRGDGPNEMGDSLPYVDLGTGRTAVAIGTAYCAASAHTCAILDNDAMKCWGGGSYNIGQLGYGDTTSRGDGPNEMGDNLPYVDLGSV
ncbi:EGF-like domain-containing protein [Pseudoscourfieldia marina]